jgi:hypothetical protein
MALETLVYADGVWSQRSAELQPVLDQKKNPRRSAKVQSSEAAPDMGVLTRTVIGSPVINWIIPARIRDQGKIDVVFIGVRIPRPSLARCN